MGSTKRQLDELTPMISGAGAHFVGSHPMPERLPPGAARADLFDGAVCVVRRRMTPTTALHSVNEFWKNLAPSRS